MHRFNFWLALALLVGGAVSSSAFAQSTYTWNNTGTDFASAANWSPNGGPPLDGDTAQFNPNGSPIGSVVVNPNISGHVNQQVKSLTIAPNQNFGRWAFTGSDGFIIGDSGSTGLTTYGPATYSFNGPQLAGAGPSIPLNFNIGHGSTFVLTGNSTATSNVSAINVNGGTFRLDNSTSIQTRLGTGGTIALTGGGSFQLIGNASATVTQNVGFLSQGTANVTGGVNSFEVNSAGQLTILNFASSGNFTSRPGTRGVYRYVATTGNLGDANGARITFVGTPLQGANGLLANTSGSGSVGFAIVTDASGTNFATYSGTLVNGAKRGIVATTATKTVTDAAGLATLTASDRGQFNPAADTTITTSGNVTTGSLRITPGGSGAVLALGGSNLATNALMLDGPNDFTITASSASVFGVSDPHYIYVNDPTAILTIDGLKVASGAVPSVFAGPGFVDLTGTASQNTLSGTNARFVIAGGTVRGNNTQIGFSSSGPGTISLTGGVLEIKDGGNGIGASADFTRPLGSSAGNVTWGAATSTEIGSGGFSAFGSNASVNIGGNATPTPLQWGQPDFVGDGFALIFGSTKSNAVLTFLNPLQLDNGTKYSLREIQVIGGAGGDRTVLAGAISGAANADLVKTGSGILELTSANTYSGNTFVQQGTLVASNASGSATGTGSVNVFTGATLRGTGAIAGPTNIATGGTLAPGGLVNTGVLTINNSVSFVGGSSAIFNIRANGNSLGDGTSPSGYDQLAVTSGTVDLNNATLDVSVGYSPSGSDHLLILNNSTGVTLNSTFNGLADGSMFTAGGVQWKIYYGSSADGFGGLDGNDVVIVPVPEPAGLLAIGLGGLGVIGLVARSRIRLGGSRKGLC